MTVHTCRLFLPGRDVFYLTGFTASSTLLSYCLHWYLLKDDHRQTSRITWTGSHKNILLILATSGAISAAFFFYHLREYWIQIAIPAFISLIYTAPKITALNKLKSLAYGKTFLLAFTWTYVTVVLPLWIYDYEWDAQSMIFFISRFSLLYAICLLFDFRDRKEDKAQGLTTLPSRISLQSVRIVFYAIMAIFLISTSMLFNQGFKASEIMTLLLPGIILVFIFPICTRSFNDYLYYFILDGLMMLSAIMSILIAF
jgi:1,4-dihydroxy-2-naphthoate octaprenyltransferase